MASTPGWSNAMPKLTSLTEAVDRLVGDGDVVYLAGFTHLIPFAAGHEIIRQGKCDLVLARATPDLIYDQMVAAGVARKVIFSYAGNPGVGSLRALRRAIEGGAVDWEEYSHFAMISRLAAGAAGLPFMPMNPSGGDDLMRVNPNIRQIADPYSGRPVITVPALNPDVAVVHVHRADADGNAQVDGIIGDIKEAAFAARKVLITAEQIVDQSRIRRDPGRTVIPGIIVSAVVHVPHGAHPSYAYGLYDRDNPFYQAWGAVSAEPSRLAAWLDEWVYGVRAPADYWEKLGPAAHARLAPSEVER
jgi:glutaconate CoA-transferase subunit A